MKHKRRFTKSEMELLECVLVTLEWCVRCLRSLIYAKDR